MVVADKLSSSQQLDFMMKSSCWLDESLSSTTIVLFQRIYQLLNWYNRMRNLHIILYSIGNQCSSFRHCVALSLGYLFSMILAAIFWTFGVIQSLPLGSHWVWHFHSPGAIFWVIISTDDIFLLLSIFWCFRSCIGWSLQLYILLVHACCLNFSSSSR